MSEFKVASRYAKALIDLATEQGNLEGVKGDMQEFIAVLRSSKELQAVLKNPIIKQDKKSNILDDIFEKKIHPSIVEFFHILVRKGRGNILYATAKEFIREYNEVKGIVKATVTSATALSEENYEALKASIAKEINATVVLENKVDPSLIGGFIIQVGDKQLNASIAGRLNKLERYFGQEYVS